MRASLPFLLSLGLLIGLAGLETDWRSVTEVPSVSAEATLGDVNGDGVIDSRDAFFVLGFQAGIIFPPGLPPGNFNVKADVNEDGFVNSIDAFLILQFHAGLLENLPPESPAGRQPDWFNGDANCDGRINSLDALAVLQLEAGLLDALPFADGGDPNGDGAVNSVDALLVLQFDAGLMPDRTPDPCISIPPGPGPS